MPHATFLKHALAIVAALIITHAFSLVITTFRLKYRYSRDRLWFDDAFAILVGVGELFIVGVLVSGMSSTYA